MMVKYDVVLVYLELNIMAPERLAIVSPEFPLCCIDYFISFTNFIILCVLHQDCLYCFRLLLIVSDMYESLFYACLCLY